VGFTATNVAVVAGAGAGAGNLFINFR